MAKQQGGESIKLPRKYLLKLRKHKKDTGIPIATFICQAIDDKLKDQTSILEPMDEATKHLLRRATDPTYGVKVTKPKQNG